MLVRYPRTDGRYVYWPVPKCATTSMAQACHQAGWQRITTHIPEGHDFAVVRHPVDRWFSGINEYIINNRLDRDVVMEKARAGRLVFDQHTVPQVDYLPDGCELIPLHLAAARVKDFGLVLPHMRHREWPVYPDLIPAIEAHYAEDLTLWEDCQRKQVNGSWVR